MSKSILMFKHCSTSTDSVMPAVEKIVAGHPAQTVRNHYTDSSGQFFSGEWTGEIGAWKIRYTEDEFCFLTRGFVKLIGEDGSVTEIRAGDAFVIPSGFNGVWEVVEACHKFYAIFERKV